MANAHHALAALLVVIQGCATHGHAFCSASGMGLSKTMS